MIAALVAGWFAYMPGLGGTFLLDDASNLGGLKSIDDWISKLNFILSGSAGPLGRPLALATFVPQASAWGQSAEVFLTANVLLHLINAALLAWVLYRISTAREVDQDKALFAAVAAAAIWLFMPLLASSSLMIVQRMTTLSAFFVLLGLAGYLQARQALNRRPAAAFAGMSLSLVAGATLAAFSKENGALLPTLVLVIEATLLDRPKAVQLRRWRAWAALFLVLPTLLILAYLVSRVPYSAEIVLSRDFTGWERLLTEARVLWGYLFNAFVPQPGSFGPFHDGYPIARTLLNPVTFIAVAGWLTVLALAATWRRRYPLPAFAILWFIAGHLLESTVIPLELYFEHRNYVPIIGPVYALSMLVAGVRPPRQRLARGGLAGYVAVNAAILLAVTSVWGNPPRAAEYWHSRFPESARASTNVATWQLQQQGPAAAALSLRNLVRRQPGVGYVKIQELNLACIHAPRKRHAQLAGELRDLLSEIRFSAIAVTMLSELFTTITRTECRDVDAETVRTLAAQLLSNPRYKNNRRHNQLHHQLLARILRHEGKYEATLEQLRSAMKFGTSSELNMMMVTTFLDAQDFDGARRYIEQAYQDAPANPLARIVWLNDLKELRRYTEILEASRGSET